MSAMPNLLALFLLAQAPAAEPATNLSDSKLIIASDSSCPSADAVRGALANLRPAPAWPTTVVIRTGNRSLFIDLGSRGTGQRELAVGPDCSARAMSTALVIATWMDDLPAEVTVAPILRAPSVTPPALPPVHSSAYQEIGVGLATAVPSSWTPGGSVEFIRMRTQSGLGWQTRIGFLSPREVWVGNGSTRWMRATASGTLHARHASRTTFLAADLGLAIAYTSSWGTGYAENRNDRSINWGPIAGARAGIPWGRFRLWSDLRVCKWLYNDSVQIDSTSSSNSTNAALPAWEAQWSLGVSYVLP